MTTAQEEAPAIAPPSSQWRPRTNPWLIAGAVMTATFMEVLDTTVVNVSLPHIAGNMSVSQEEATWVLTSYLVANAIILPATGWLSSLFGRKRFLIGCIVLFTIASGLCGAAANLGMLILARILQGVGGGALQPISQAVLLESFPPQKRGVAMSVFGLGVVVAPIIGPTLGGWMTDNYSWRWVFYINLPVGLLAIFMTQMFIEDPPYVRANRPGKIDYLGFGLLALWIGSLQIVLDKGQQEDWFASPFIRTLAVLGGLGLVAFIARELMTASPLVDLRILKNRNFATGTLLMTVMGAVLYGSVALLPLFLQTLLGYSSMQSGLTTSPRGFGSICGMLLVGRMLGIINGRFLICAGFTILAYSTWQFGNLNLMIAPRNVIWPNIVNGFATALVFVPLTTLTMGTLRNEQMGNAAGIFNLMRNLGGGIGIALVTTLLSRGSQAHQADLSGHLSTSNPVFAERHAMLTQGFSHELGRHAASGAANGVLYGELLRQSALAAYIDNFRLLAMLCIVCVPFLLLFKKAQAKGPISVH
jgi:DHA2 family multidrug resistance protein